MSGRCSRRAWCPTSDPVDSPLTQLQLQGAGPAELGHTLSSHRLKCTRNCSPCLPQKGFAQPISQVQANNTGLHCPWAGAPPVGWGTSRQPSLSVCRWFPKFLEAQQTCTSSSVFMMNLSTGLFSFPDPFLMTFYLLWDHFQINDLHSSFVFSISKSGRICSKACSIQRKEIAEICSTI